MATRRGTTANGRNWAAVEATPGMWLLGFGTQVTEAIVRAPYGDKLGKFLSADDPRRTRWSIVLCNVYPEVPTEFADTLEQALSQAAGLAVLHL